MDMSFQFISLFLDLAQQISQQGNPKEEVEDLINNQYESQILHSPSNSLLTHPELSTSNLNINYTSCNSSMQQTIQQEFDMSIQMQQKQNIIKNILKGFQKHFRKISNSDAAEKYSPIIDNPQNILNIKKNFFRVVKNKNARWNYILKSVIKSKNLSKIFCNYLETDSKVWLSHSRTSDVMSHKSMIELLKRAIKQGVQINIKTYKKK